MSNNQQGGNQMDNKGQHEVFGYLLNTIIVIAALLFIFAVANPIAIVGPGERGVLTTWGAVADYSLPEGLHLKWPIAQQVYLMDVKTQKYSAEASSASRDLQEVKTEVVVNFHINPETAHKIFQEIGNNQIYGDKVIQPAIQESVKAATAIFNAEELITKRPTVKQAIESALQQRLSVYNIDQETVSITDFQFSKQFNEAIESKVTAEQDALKASNILKRIEIEADQKRTKAQGDADARLIEAEAEAKALELQKEQITDKLLTLRVIEKWNGEVPEVATGFLPFVDALEVGK